MSSDPIRDLQTDSGAEAPDNVTHLPGTQPERSSVKSEPAEATDERGLGIWLATFGALAFIGLVVFAATQYQRANALDAAVAGLNSQLESTRGVLVATEADLELNRTTLGVYAERIEVVRGRVDSIATQIGELQASSPSVCSTRT